MGFFFLLSIAFCKWVFVWFFAFIYIGKMSRSGFSGSYDRYVYIYKKRPNRFLCHFASLPAIYEFSSCSTSQSVVVLPDFVSLAILLALLWYPLEVLIFIYLMTLSIYFCACWLFIIFFGKMLVRIFYVHPVYHLPFILLNVSFKE